MKIVHVCLACVYCEGMGYQENILPRKHKEMGYDVTVITTYLNIENQNNTASKIGEDGVKLIKIPRRTDIFGKRLNCFRGLYGQLKAEKPTVIFVHGGQFGSYGEIITYLKKNKGVRMYLDNHSDYINTPLDNLKKKLWYRYVTGHYVRKLAQYAAIVWGVTPSRMDYLKNVYKVPENKVRLLVMGGDESKIDFEKSIYIRKKNRRQLGIQEEDFVIVSGGKIDLNKKIVELMQAIHEINKELRVILILFGKVDEALTDIFVKSLYDKNIIYIGWIDPDDVYDWFLTSDLAVFPGTHSVLWEQAVASGVPCVFRYWKGFEHIDVGGNCLFVNDGSIEELIGVIKMLLTDKKKFEKLDSVAKLNGPEHFSYKRIAERAIECGVE